MHASHECVFVCVCVYSWFYIPWNQFLLWFVSLYLLLLLCLYSFISLVRFVLSLHFIFTLVSFMLHVIEFLRFFFNSTNWKRSYMLVLSLLVFFFFVKKHVMIEYSIFFFGFLLLLFGIVKLCILLLIF